MINIKLKIHTILCALVVLMLFNVGCSNSSTEPNLNPKNTTLKIAYISEDMFQRRYANLLSQEFPNLRYEVIPIFKRNSKQIDTIDWDRLSKEADVVYIPGARMKQSVEHLLDLEPFIKRDQWDLQAYVPGIVELTRQYGGGHIYGLPPTFDGQVIAYNKDLFDQLKVDYPAHPLEWGQLFQISERLSSASSNKQRTIGLSHPFGSPWDLIQQMGLTYDLEWFNKDTNRVMLNNKAWRNIWDMVLPQWSKGNIATDNQKQMFVSGQSAMAIISYEDYKKLEQRKPKFRWATVPMPINPSRPDVTTQLYVQGFYSIPNSSVNAEAAWKLVKFLNSDKAAKWEYRSNYGFSTRQSNVTLNKGDLEYLDPFYTLTPIIPERIDSVKIEELAAAVIDDILQHKVSIANGLNRLEQEAEQIMNMNHKG